MQNTSLSLSTAVHNLWSSSILARANLGSDGSINASSDAVRRSEQSFCRSIATVDSGSNPIVATKVSGDRSSSDAILRIERVNVWDILQSSCGLKKGKCQGGAIYMEGQ